MRFLPDVTTGFQTYCLAGRLGNFWSRCGVVLPVLCAVFLVTACGEGGRSGQASTSGNSTASGDASSAEPTSDLRKHPQTGDLLARTQELVRGNGSEPASLDPQVVEGNVGGKIIVDLFEGLTTSGPEGDVRPGVARSWSASDDKLTWTFYLRNGARWSDGTPVTAHDFVYGWRRAVSPELGSNYAYYLATAGVENARAITHGKKPPESLGVRAVDDHTLEVSLNDPITYLPEMTVHYTMFPAPQKVIEKHGDDWTKPGNMVSNGAYKLQSWNVGAKLVAVRNPEYWDNDNTLIDKVTYLPIESVSAELQRFESGGIDFTATVPVSQMDRLRRTQPKALTISPFIGTYMYQFNVNKAPFDDVRVRKALTYAIDRRIITKYITKGGQKSAYSLTPGYVNDFELEQPEYGTWSQEKRDAEAKRLLAEAGYDKDNRLQFELLYNTNDGHRAIAVAISQMWKEKLGAQVTPTNLEWKTFLSEKHIGNFAVARHGWIGDYNEASTFLNLMLKDSGNNDGGWSNAEYDSLLEKARSRDDPSALYAQAEDILWEEFPMAPIYFYTNVALVNPRLHGYPVNNPQNKIYSKDMYIEAQ
jgi:oligopeptide transport system substrate-binding protein